jgi:hypothetical protein
MEGTLAKDMTVHRGMPEKMRAGREIRGMPHNVDQEHNKNGMVTRKLRLNISVKGFEDPVLAKGIENLVTKIVQCVQWTEEVWGDMI